VRVGPGESEEEDDEDDGDYQGMEPRVDRGESDTVAPAPRSDGEDSDSDEKAARAPVKKPRAAKGTTDRYKKRVAKEGSLVGSCTWLVLSRPHPPRHRP
jgi:hypothetical protein